MTKCKYAAIFAPFDDGTEGYTVTFPDLPGCVTEGDDIAEAVQMAAEAASLWLDNINPLPEPIDIDSVKEFYAADGDLVYNIKVIVDEDVITPDILKVWAKEFGYRLIKDNPMPKLKRCVCGGQASQWYGREGRLYVCKKCGCKGPQREKKRDAIEAWNEMVSANDAT